MRRWTLLVVSHDAEAPQSFSVSERTVRVAAGGVAVVVLVAMVGLGTISARLRRLGDAEKPKVTATSTPSPDPHVGALRDRLGALRLTVDSIGAVDDSLTRLTGGTEADSTVLTRVGGRVPRLLRSGAPATATQGRADSLLDHARLLHERLRTLDSTARRRR